MMDKHEIRDLIPAEMRREWREAGYYPGKSLYELFADKVDRHPDKDAVCSVAETVSYRELNQRVLRIAGGLRRQGIGAGDVLAYQLPNSWKCVALDLAAACLGAVVVPYPPGRDAADIVAILNRSRATLVVVAEGAQPLMENVRGSLPYVRHFYVDTEMPCADHSYWKTFSNLLDEQFQLDAGELDCGDRPARFIISSGTESNPKLVAYSHDALIGGRGRFIAKLAGRDAGIRALYLVPLGSAFGSSATAGVLAFLGGTLLMLPGFDAKQALDGIERLAATHVLGVPTMFQRMLQDEAHARTATATVRVIVSGGALVDEVTVRRCRELFDCDFVSLYGSADGINCHTDAGAAPEEIVGHVGRPDSTICEIRIIGEQGRLLLDGEIGEIVCRGPISPMQYVNNPELDMRYRDAEGWVFTGDLGRFDEQGRLILCGRKKDIIIRGGLNISPVQIEDLMTAHPDVLGCACIAVPDRDLGERVCVCLMQKRGARILSLTDMRRYLAGRGLARNKLPDYLLLKRQLPLNPSGKVDKKSIATNIARDFFEA